MLGHKFSRTQTGFALLFVLTLFFEGCVVYEPVPTPVYPGSSYDRVWDSALGAAEDAGVKITHADKTTGLVRGVTGSTDITISVRTQTDGRIRVEFRSKGPAGEDSEVNDRLTRLYNRRMGRM
jgi:hypothetical protein